QLNRATLFGEMSSPAQSETIGATSDELEIAGLRVEPQRVAGTLILHADVHPVDLVNRAVRERDDKQVAIRPGLDVGADPEVTPEEQALAFGDVKFVSVVGHTVFEPRVIHGDPAAVAGQVEVEQVSAGERRPGGAHEQVALILRPERRAVQEADAGRGDGKLPA